MPMARAAIAVSETSPTIQRVGRPAALRVSIPDMGLAPPMSEKGRLRTGKFCQREAEYRKTAWSGSREMSSFADRGWSARLRV
jgi:hypothetical protein